MPIHFFGHRLSCRPALQFWLLVVCFGPAFQARRHSAFGIRCWDTCSGPVQACRSTSSSPLLARGDGRFGKRQKVRLKKRKEADIATGSKRIEESPERTRRVEADNNGSLGRIPRLAGVNIQRRPRIDRHLAEVAQDIHTIRYTYIDTIKSKGPVIETS